MDTTDGGATPAGAVFTVGTEGGISIGEGINAGQSSVQLVAGSGGGVAQITGAVINAGSLGVVEGIAPIQLTASNAITGANGTAGVLAGTQFGGEPIQFNNLGAGVSALEVGTITLVGAAAAEASGMGQSSTLIGVTDNSTTAPVRSGFVSVGTLGELSVASALDVYSGTVERRHGRHQRVGRGDHGWFAVALANGGDITLDQTNSITGASNAAGNFAAEDAFAGGAVRSTIRVPASAG